MSTVLERGTPAPAHTSALAAPEHAGRVRQRQARRGAAIGMALCLALVAAGDCLAAPQDDAGATERERQLENEQRLLRGRIETLDRELAPCERQRLRPSAPDPRIGGPRRVTDPLGARKDLERRTLQDRERLIDQDLRRQQFDRTTGGRP